MWDRASLVAQRLKCLPGMWETLVRSLSWEDPLEKEMATHSSTLAWRIPWREEPGRLQSMGLQSQTRLSDFTFFNVLPKSLESKSNLVIAFCPKTRKHLNCAKKRKSGREARTQTKKRNKVKDFCLFLCPALPLPISHLTPEDGGKNNGIVP